MAARDGAALASAGTDGPAPPPVPPGASARSWRRSGMALDEERCPQCGHALMTTRFDTTFRLPDESERLCFGIPGSLCADCHQLYVDPGLIELLDLGSGRCVFAIESDTVLQEEAWS